MITLSGFIKSWIAQPSFKNSGLEATSKSIDRPLLCRPAAMTLETKLAVPTGTVDLLTITR
ncbi:hypothetical protein NEOC65_000985 [Neochlamydia sp. AcF65]|nr:hypothetical protein [Neochlamydia sp. AcF65]MBS4170554.1 hypothetical protein [Neochlamydia sp. AcF95]